MAKPVAPNYTDLAKTQGAENRSTAIDAAQQNRYSQFDAQGGSNVWGVDPTTGVATNTTTMGQKPQAYYDALMDNGTSNLKSFQDQYYGPNAGGGGGGGGGVNVNLGGTGAGAGNIPGTIQTDLDYSHLSAMPGEDIGKARQEAQDALYKRSAGYLDPQWQEKQRSTETQLANQGLTPGTPAYDRAYANLQRAQESAYTGARQDAIAGGGLEAERAQKMALELRNQGVTEAGNLGTFHNAAQNQGATQYLDDLKSQRSLQGQLGAAGISAGASMHNADAANALNLRKQQYDEATGMGEHAQKYLPQITKSSNADVQPYKAADLAGAADKQYQDEIDRYNAKKAKKGNLLGSVLGIAGGIAGNTFAPGIGGALGAKLGSSLGGSLSDVRLKSNIWPVGKTQGGHNVYDYDLLGHRERGVMAQEVQKMLPEAVTRGDDGWLRVDYSKVR